MKYKNIKINLRLKDKIFIAIIIMGLFFAFTNKFITKNNEKLETDNDITKINKNESVKNNSVNFNKQIDSKIKVSIAGNALDVFVANTEAQRYRGLSGRENLEDNSGMLFLFENYDKYRFVMRNINFNLDFIFIHDEEIVDLKESIKKSFSGEIYSSKKYDKVIETKEGWIKDNNILVGDKIEINY